MSTTFRAFLFVLLSGGAASAADCDVFYGKAEQSCLGQIRSDRPDSETIKTSPQEEFGVEFQGQYADPRLTVQGETPIFGLRINGVHLERLFREVGW